MVDTLTPYVRGSKGPKWTGPGLLANGFERFELDDGAFGWVYTFQNREPIPIPAHAVVGHEVAVQLAGCWELSVWNRAPEVFEAGSVFTVPAGVRHTYRFRAREGHAPGLQVGFSFPSGGFLPTSGLLAWRRAEITGTTAAAFLELAIRAARFSTCPERSALTRELRRLVALELVEVEQAGFVRARRALEEHLDRPLYLEHLAEAAGLGAKTLSRRFVENTGLTPIRLRTELRLQRAIRLLWSRPTLSVADAGRAVGFESARFFHRAAMSVFGMTPAQLARRNAARRAG